MGGRAVVCGFVVTSGVMVVHSGHMHGHMGDADYGGNSERKKV